jgi:glycosyltransferase involved in cell wall biosynthesis
MRLAYLVTHPIQYQAPLLGRITAESDIDLTVFFESDISLGPFLDRGFGTEVRWDVPLLKGYQSRFLPALGRRNKITFGQPLNYGLAKQLIEGRFDALWVHGYMRWFHWTAMVQAKRLGMRVLVRDEPNAISSRRGMAKKVFKRWFFSMLQRVTDGFLTIGTLNREYYAQNGIDSRRIYSMPYCVDNSLFQSLAHGYALHRNQLRASLGLKPGRPIILYAGKFMPRKAPLDLVRAYIDMSPDGVREPNPYLLFVGDGEERRTAEVSAAEKHWESIKFLGFKNQTEIPAYYDLCDVFVMPSHEEPWGLVVNEAMNAGRPVIVSDRCGCHPDLVRDGLNGYVYRTGDVSHLTEVLRRVLADPDRRRTMGEQSLRIINRWSFEEDVAGLRDALGLDSGAVRNTASC